MKMRPVLCLFLSLLLVALTGCSSTYYSAWEKMGVYKRDLLKKRVVAARDEQKEAGQQFKDALTRLKELYGFKGGDLEKVYDSLKSDLDRSSSKADAVRKRVKEVEGVSADLFSEWETELKQISSASLRDKSREQLSQTRDRYETLHQALKSAEKSMDPVLAQFRDQVLYLKHNLNAQALSSLQKEALNIQDDITNLLAEMDRSIRQADSFIKQLP
ncbi:MAG: DUF2959 domain-containing protein [Verrucomicrobiota bacterium]